ncbi:hypothetical protein [Xanthomonas sp. LMG 12460]|uniref:hypothetical protein n=1 Tax=Xanthomonas sp. LMG 12460 TaxID=1591132 RepID=UPI0012647179|nr:hypothetical protein [Xanthomonas sp. LMG 12460]
MEYFERVKILSKDPNLSELDSREGVVIGFSETSASIWCAIYVDGKTWMIQENDLVRLDDKVDPQTIYPPSTA